jgi:amidase
MPIKDYKTISREKLAANAAKIPKEWLLSSKHVENFNANSSLNVLDIPRTCGILTAKEIDITENYDATALLEKMASKQFSSYDVVLAFCKRAAIAHQLVRYGLFSFTNIP